MWYYYLGLILIAVSAITLLVVKWSEHHKKTQDR